MAKERFEYNGFTFEPIRQFNKKEDKMGFGEFVYKKTKHDELNAKSFSLYNNGNWNYDSFYMAARKVGAQDIDIFLCVETHNLYVPSASELYIFTGK